MSSNVKMHAGLSGPEIFMPSPLTFQTGMTLRIINAQWADKLVYDYDIIYETHVCSHVTSTTTNR